MEGKNRLWRFGTNTETSAGGIREPDDGVDDSWEFIEIEEDDAQETNASPTKLDVEDYVTVQRAASFSSRESSTESMNRVTGYSRVSSLVEVSDDEQGQTIMQGGWTLEGNIRQLGASATRSNSESDHQRVLPADTSKEKVIKRRTALLGEARLEAALTAQIPAGLFLGRATDQGDCFFDALAQIINKMDETNDNTDKRLRELCYQYYLSNKELINEWSQEGDDHYSWVQYTAEECEARGGKRGALWGRPWVEGRILCRQLNLEAICVIEILEEPETKQPVTSFHLVTGNDYKNITEEDASEWMRKARVPTLVVEQNSLHFVPLMDSEQKDPAPAPASALAPASPLVDRVAGSSSSAGASSSRASLDEQKLLVQLEEKSWFCHVVMAIRDDTPKPQGRKDKTLFASLLVMSVVANRLERFDLPRLRLNVFREHYWPATVQFKSRVANEQITALELIVARGANPQDLSDALNAVIERCKREEIKWIFSRWGEREARWVTADGQQVALNKVVCQQLRQDADRFFQGDIQQQLCEQFLAQITDNHIRDALIYRMGCMEANSFEVNPEQVATSADIKALKAARFRFYLGTCHDILNTEKVRIAQENVAQCEFLIKDLRAKALKKLQKLHTLCTAEPGNIPFPDCLDRDLAKCQADLQKVYFPHHYQDAKGNTLLHYFLCREFRNIPLAALLVRTGEGTDVTNSVGQTPLQMLLERECRQFLQIVTYGKRSKSKLQQKAEEYLADYSEQRKKDETSWLRSLWLSGDEQVKQARKHENVRLNKLFKKALVDVTDDGWISYLRLITGPDKITNAESRSRILSKLKREILAKIVCCGDDNDNVAQIPGDECMRQPTLSLVPRAEDEATIGQLKLELQHAEEEMQRMERAAAEREAELERVREESRAKDVVIQDQGAVIQDQGAVIQTTAEENAQLKDTVVEKDAEINRLETVDERRDRDYRTLMAMVTQLGNTVGIDFNAALANQGGNAAPPAVALPVAAPPAANADNAVEIDQQRRPPSPGFFGNR